MTDSMNLTKIIKEVQPDEIYNLAAMIHVHVSFQIPEYVANTDGMGTLRILEAIRLLGLTEKKKFIKPQLLSYWEKHKKFLNLRLPPFTLGAPMLLQNYMVFG